MTTDLQKGIKLSLIEALLVIVALFAAALVGGPLARIIFGVPLGFRQDFVSAQANAQALLVQLISVGLVLVFVGAACGRFFSRRTYQIVMIVVSPLVVAIAFIIFKLIFESIPFPRDLEYYNVRNGMIVVISSPVFLGISCIVSRHISAN